MSDDVVTLALEGDVSLADFARATQAFDHLLRSLTRTVTPHSDLEWFVEHLDSGSAVMTARPEGTDLRQAESVSEAYRAVGRSLSEHEPIPYPPEVVESARQITNLINGRIPSVRFETARDTYVIDMPLLQGPTLSIVERERTITARGAVEGVVQTLSNRKGLRFTLYDVLFDKAVSCYLRQGQESLMRDVWGKRAIVEGTVTRDPNSGRPLAIRGITDVQLVRDRERGAYRRARGVAPAHPGDQSPEELIRQLRDAE